MHAQAQQQQQTLLDARQQQTLTSPYPQAIAAIQSQIAQHIASRAGAGSNSMKVNDMTEAMMLQSALVAPGLAQLRSVSTGGHAFIPPASMGAQQPTVSQQQHPFEQEVSILKGFLVGP